MTDQDDLQAAEITKTWNKIEKKARKAGLRDGISNGRDSHFQESFDEGFRYGYLSGYAIGQYKGALFANNIPETKLLEQPKTGWCQICTNQDSQNISASVEKQTEATNRNLGDLHSLYSEVGVDLKSQINY